MWTSEKLARKATAARRTLPTAARSNVRSSNAFEKAATPFYVKPIVWSKTVGKVTLVKALSN